MAWKQLELRLFGKGFCLLVVLTGLAMASFSPGIGRVDAAQEVGLVAHYQFENNVQDSAGSNHGTNHGATFVEGKLGTALHFDGVDDYVEVPDAAVLRLTPPFTLEAWVHPEGEGSADFSNNPIIWKIGTVGRNDDNYALGWGGGVWCGGRGISQAFILRIERASDSENFHACSYSHPINQWYHVVGLYDGTTLQIYVNGGLVGKNRVGSFLPYTGSAPLQIGGLTHSNHDYQGSFKGAIDEVRIYNQALSKEEVEQHYQDEVATSGAPTVTVVSPNGREVWRETQTITWTATDPQADPLTYTVYYSPNGGQNWTQLATGLTASFYRLDTTTVMAGTNCMIKVEASDGTHTGADVSNTPFEIVYEPFTTAPSKMGRIVVLADNGPINDSYWSISSRTFTLNIFGWLTEFSPGKEILGNHWRDLEHMLDILRTYGYSVDIGLTKYLRCDAVDRCDIIPINWTQARLEGNDAVFLVIDEYPIDDTVLIEYVNGGGSVFLIGGTQHSGSDKYKEFLLHFGMSLQEHVNLSERLTSFVPHSVTTGVSELRVLDPTPIEVHSSDPRVLSTYSDWNLLVVYSIGGGEWRSRALMPTPRNNIAAVVVNERIYVIGGFNGTQNLAIVEEYDPATDTWRSRAPMPTARGWLAATAVNGKIYVLGGWDGTKYLPTVEEYDPATNTWRPRADMPTHRYGLAVVAIGGRIYAIGGQNEIAEGYQKTVEEYDPATDTWRSRADMATRRYGLAAGVVRGRIYALGGYNVIEGPLATVEEYNPIHNTWCRVADMTTAQISLAAGTVGGRLYAIGGFETYPSPLEEYDPLIDAWERRTPLPTPRAGLAAAVVRGRLYAIGGYDGNRRLGTIEEYDPLFYDTDRDGFADDEELRYGRDPLVPEPATITDTDGDGLLDTDEVTKYGTNPWVPDAEADTDGDGLANVAEVDSYGTTPTAADTDSDGLGDGAEVLTYETDPLVVDTDGDGLADGAEVLTYETDPLVVDTDGDTFSDGAEVNRYGTNPTVVDTDRDGLGDGTELLTYETDPLVVDTDGDTYSDGVEVAAGTNPLDPAEYPSTTTGTVTDTATMDTPAAFIPGFCSVELLLALACLVVLARWIIKQ